MLVGVDVGVADFVAVVDVGVGIDITTLCAVFRVGTCIVGIADMR